MFKMFHTKQDVDRHVNEVFRNIKSEHQRNLKCYQIAKLYHKFKDYKSAVRYLNRYILSTSNSAPAHRLLGECYLGLNLKVKALNAFKTSLECNGIQHDLVLKICSLLMDPEVFSGTPKASYWLDRAESLFPSNPIVFQLREHILKSNMEGKQDNGQLEKLILSEIKARPTDVTVRIRLLNFFLETKRYKVAFLYAMQIEEKNTFSSDPRWYDCLCNVIQAYEKANSETNLNQPNFSFLMKKLFFLEKRADLFLQDFRDPVKSVSECSQALFTLDQSLLSISAIEVSSEDSPFFKEVLKHMSCQLSFHLATLSLRRAKREYGIWLRAVRTATPLLLQATQNTMDLDEKCHNMWVEKTKMESEFQYWNKSAALRVFQAGHILLAWSENKSSKFLEKVSQFCGGKWQNQAYKEIFYSRDHLEAVNTSFFIKDSFFSCVPMRLLSETDLRQFNDVAQSAYPDSLHHLVWLGLANCDANGQLNSNFRCTTVPDLQFTVENLTKTGPETLNQLDVDAFLYASVFCGKSATTISVNTDRPSKLPASISEDLCTPAQAEWWVAVHQTYTNVSHDNIAQMRLKLRKGIETIRAMGEHGLDVKVLVMLAKAFQERATGSTIPVKTTGLEERAYLYWSAAIPLLERADRNQKQPFAPNRLFHYWGKELTQNEIKGYLEDGKLFLALRLMKRGQHEEAIDAFQCLKSPYATFHQGLIYEKLASEEVNHRPESITSENRSQHIILLTRARDAFYLTLDRLRCPSVDPNHPLNSQLQDHLEKVEKQLAMIDPDNSLNRNGDTESDETDTVPQPISPDIEDNVGSNLNIFNTSNFLSLKSHGTPRNLRHNLSDKHALRYEARPSPERLDAQLRHLVQANSNGLQAVLEHLKDIKSIIQIEMKDLGCVTRDLLAEMRKWNEKMDYAGKKEIDALKPEELFNFGDEEYEDLNQIPQSYAPYHSYMMNRSSLPGTHVASGIPFGTSSPAIPPGESSLLPPSFYPNHQVDPVLLYRGFGCYSGLSFNDPQNMTDMRGSGVQKDVRKKKGVIPGKGSYRSPEIVAPTASVSVGGSITTPGVFVAKSEPPNVVITSSDVLPVFTATGTPTLSVTIPPQHIRCSTPSSTSQKLHTNQVHPFQINIPPNAQLVKESPTGKLNSLMPVTTTSPSLIQNPVLTVDNMVTSQPVSQFGGTNLTKISSESPKQNSEINSTFESKTPLKPSEVKMFESDGQLFVLEDKDWKEQGSALIKVVHSEDQKKLKVVTLRDPTMVSSVYVITLNTVVEPLKNSDVGWTLSVPNLQNTISKVNAFNREKEVWPKFCIKFSQKSQAENFEKALVEGLRLLNMNQTNIIQKTTLFKTLTKQCADCKKPFDGTADLCPICVQKKPPNEKLNFGGFTFSSSPIVQPVVSSKTVEKKEEPKETPKPSPFAEFSFSSSSVTSAASTKPTTTSSAISTSGLAQSTPTVFGQSANSMFNTQTSGHFNPFAAVKADPNSFKKDANFKGFKGQNSLVFGHLNKEKTPSKSPGDATKSSANEDDFNVSGQNSLVFGHLNKEKTSSKSPGDATKSSANEDEADDFVPTAEFTPVVKLPDLVDTKTGEENDEVLFDERAKLLRFDTRTKEWKERGVGNMKLLLNDESGKVRLIMRREIVLKVCCNHYLDESIGFEPYKKNETTVIWCAQDYSEGEVQAEMFALKFKTPQLMSKFLNTVQSTQGRMKNGKIEGKGGDKVDTEKPSNELKPLSQIFKPKVGSWECRTCLTRNDETKLKCVCCESPKPGIESSVKEPAQPKLLLGKGIVFPPTTITFTFGIPQQSTPNTSNMSQNSTPIVTTSTGATGFQVATTTTASSQPNKFNFGFSSVTVTTSTNAPPTFSFGLPSTNAGATTTTASIFGMKPATVTTASSGFTFGISTSAVTTSEPLFQTPTIKTTFFSPTTTSTSQNFSNIFGGSHLKKPDDKVVSSVPRFGLSKPAESKTETSSNLSFSFGSALKLQEKNKFEFSVNNSKTPNKTDLGKIVSPNENAASPVSGDDTVEEDNGDHIVFNPVVPLPEKVDPHTGEEDEYLKYEQRAKLYRYCDKEWKERGIGDVKILKHKTNDKIRLLMRRETILKVCLNQYVTSDIVFHKKDEKSWHWTAPDFSEGEVKYETFAIRFKTAEIADDFMNTLNKVKNNEEIPGKAKEPTQGMKNFSFAMPNLKGSTPISFGRKLQTMGASDEDISIVYESKVTPEEREKAVALGLPPNFYSYTQAPDCPGCAGCDKDEGLDIPATTSSTAPSYTLSSQPLFGSALNKGGIGGSTYQFGSSSDRKFTFGQGTPLYSFGGNQATIVPSLNTFNPSKTNQSEGNGEEDDGDDEEGEDEEYVEGEAEDEEGFGEDEEDYDEEQYDDEDEDDDDEDDDEDDEDED